MQSSRKVLSLFAVILTITLAASACSKTADTMQVSAQDVSGDAALPTSTMLRAAAVTTTALPVGSGSATNASTAAVGSAQATLAAILGQISANPQILTKVSTLDTAGLAQLFGLDVSALQQLGLSGGQIEQLGQAALASPESVQTAISTGSIDPAALLGLLLGSVDINSLATGAVGALVQGLLASIADLRLVISPEVTVDLQQLFDQIDPNAIPILANPGNAGILALLFSAVINSNPLLAQQLLDNPNLDPTLRPILEQLAALGDSLGTAASAALIEAINKLFPGLLPVG
ncbi:MAG: hypothetical protein WCJ04_09225 [Actinomycetes bacterium]